MNVPVLLSDDTSALGDAAFEEFLGGQLHGEVSVPDVQRVGEDGRARATGQPELCRLGRGLGEHLSFQDELRSEEHTSELQSRFDLVCRLLLEKKKIDLDTANSARHGAQTVMAHELTQ